MKEIRFCARVGDEKEAKDTFRKLYDHVLDSIGLDRYKFFKIKLTEERSSGRYKYYFGHVVDVIFLSGFYQSLTDGYVLKRDDVHDLIKWHFLADDIAFKSKAGNKIYVMPRSTTELSDGKFANEYVERIVAEFTTEYNLEFMSREEWAETFDQKQS